MRSKVDHYYGYNPSWYSSMESEHFVLIFGITCASLAIGAYVLFGPNFTSKKKSKFRVYNLMLKVFHNLSE
jgi:hypothetical protein